MDDQFRLYDASYLEEQFNRLKYEKKKVALIQLNIKNFRFYLAKYGLSASQEILQLVFTKLQEFLEVGEVVGHLYSDNFIVLAQYEDIELMARSRLVSWIDQLYRIDYPHIYRNLFFSIGIYKVEDQQVCFQEALNFANLCRKQSDDLDKRCSLIEIYDSTYYERYTNQMELEANTADAYKNYEFTTYLQPKVDLKTKEIIGAEALLRWFDKDGKNIPLSQFLPILNENNYIILVDLDMFDQVLSKLDARMKQGKKIVPVSFNISKAGFYDPDIFQEYITIFEKYNIDKKYVELEFMESISLDNTAHMKQVISQFKEYGFTCVLDDFGNGYSSFNVLLNAPLDIIKMDRQFFLDNLNGDGKLVIETIVKLIHSLNMEVVAEGVELKEHVAFLQSCGCDYVQGYYFYKPMATTEFEALLDQKKEN